MKMRQTFFGLIMVAVLLTSCEYGRQAEEKLSDFNTRVEELDATVNEGIENISNLDSVLPETSKRLKEADSIVNDASATLDSLNQKVKDIENLFN